VWIENFKPVFEKVDRRGVFNKTVNGDTGMVRRKNDDKRNNNENEEDNFLSPPKRFKKWVMGLIATIITAVAGIAWEYWRLRK